MSSLPATRAGTVTPEVIECRDVKCACPNLEQRSVTPIKLQFRITNISM
jgi:hypothetical protein